MAYWKFPMEEYQYHNAGYETVIQLATNFSYNHPISWNKYDENCLDYDDMLNFEQFMLNQGWLAAADDDDFYEYFDTMLIENQAFISTILALNPDTPEKLIYSMLPVQMSASSTDVNFSWLYVLLKNQRTSEELLTVLAATINYLDIGDAALIKLMFCDQNCTMDVIDEMIYRFGYSYETMKNLDKLPPAMGTFIRQRLHLLLF